MEKLRFNPFNQIHKGLRALLYHTSLQLQQCDFINEVQTREALAQVNEVIELFEEHAEVEDGKLFPLIQGYAPEIVADFEQQHDTDHELAVSLQNALQDVKKAETYKEKLKAGHALCLAFQEFTAFNIKHMNAEEIVVNDVLWRFYSDEELIQRQKEIASQVDPRLNNRYAYWMLKGLALHEIINWFTIVQQSAPAPVWENLKQVARTALSPTALFEIENAIASHNLTTA